MATKEKTMDIRLTPEELATEIVMSKREYLIVEGETDKLFWERVIEEFDKKYMLIVACKKECKSNKEYVQKVIHIVNERKKNNAKGVIDIDSDYITNSMCNLKNIYYYKYHDLEITLLKSNAFSYVNKCISSSEKKMGEEKLVKFLFDVAYIVGILRFINEMQEYRFNFHLIDYKKLFDVKTSQFNEEKFLEYFYSKFSITKEERESINFKIADFKNKKFPKEYICNGHDILNILSLLTIRKISNDSPIKYTEDIISQLLISSFKCSSKNEEFKDMNILFSR
ncbi:DUF4435 domain-containing protein [Lacrimispora sp.]|uniref:DUF4435 domain-containing protein n=1 Tax=Lacrimispora sp. TaxID=2719234 RepID=UPI0028A67735|nr:DUF4435 domain-containing protein [Lacrimispora sp.]